MKRTKSPLDESLRLPVVIDGAPRNAVPKQELNPLLTPRVALPRQHMKILPTGVAPVHLARTSAQTPDRLPLEPVSLKKQGIGVSGLGVERVSLERTPAPLHGRLEPMKRSTRPGSLSQRKDRGRMVDVGRVPAAMMPVRTKTSLVTKTKDQAQPEHAKYTKRKPSKRFL